MDFEIALGILLASLVFVYLIKNRAKESLHMVQLEGYDPENYLKWLNNNKKRAYIYYSVVSDMSSDSDSCS